MPNDNTAVCGCGVVLDLPKSRNGMTAISTRNFTILIPKPGNKSGSKTAEGRPAAKKPAELEQHVSRGRGPNSRASDTGSTSSVADSTRAGKSNKKDKRLNSSRRARSAERAESHYTYIDSGSSIVGSGIRENAIAEALYCTIDDDEPQASQQQSATITTATSGAANNAANLGQANNAASQNNRPQQPLYAVPSMTSPPPTYDVAIAKSWQSGLLPPSYEEYLCHKHALLSRSHTPPPPWTDSTTSSAMPTGATGGGAAANLDIQQISRELLASQPELREYLTQLALQGGAEQAAQQYQQLLSQQQALRKQAARAQRTRAMPPRSQSESRAHQQRIQTMYEDGAFCMETTAIQSAFENGVAFCSLM